MKTIVVYDSVYGNTEKIAKAIGEGVEGEVEVLNVRHADSMGPGPFGLLIVGSPTQGGRPTKPIQEFLAKVPETLLKDAKVAAFDTRYGSRFVKLFGFAADRISEALLSRGGRLASPPKAFIVAGKKGPLREGELDRAIAWGKEIGPGPP